MNINKDSLFYKDNKLFEFSATVLECEKIDDRYQIVLDNTGFFPEAGGQYADKGTLNGFEVLDVQLEETGVVHYLSVGIEKGSVVKGIIDKEEREKKERNHTAEHIVSAVVHKLFSYDNVGFHMGENFMDVDFNGEFTEDDICEIERQANKVVRDNVEVKTYFPTAEELEKITYRSKLELSAPRIVEITGCDFCACCAPHVSYTGEIGLIKIVDSYKNRGNTRLTLLAGEDALAYVLSVTRDASKSASLLSAKPFAVSQALEKKLKVLEEANREIGELKRKLASSVVNGLSKTEKYLVVFTEGYIAKDVINKGISLSQKGVCVFSENESGYAYMLASENLDMKALSERLNKEFQGKGGGKRNSAMGRISARKEQIEEFFDKEEKE